MTTNAELAEMVEAQAQLIDALIDVSLGLFDIVASTHDPNVNAVDGYNALAFYRGHQAPNNPFFKGPEALNVQKENKV